MPALPRRAVALAPNNARFHLNLGLALCSEDNPEEKMGGSVVLEVPSQLLRLAAQVDGVTEIVAAGDALPPFDLQCPMLSLPLAFGTTAASILNRIPYLSVPQEARATFPR